MRVEIYDTTLRDGSQRENISLSVDDKLKIAKLLDDLGVCYIEGGWPGSNPKDATFFERVRSLDLKHAKIAAFGMTCRVGSQPGDDDNIRALLDAECPVCTVVGKTWLLHVTDVIRATPEENLRIIRESVAYLTGEGREVIYDAEHFFDGYKSDPDYALQTLQAAVEGGATTVVLCDTNGGTLYWDVAEAVKKVAEALPNVKLGMHAHNDSELGVANTLAAVREGAVHVQGTINGYGERVGNADLCSIIPDLQIKMEAECLPDPANLAKLTHISRSVAEIVNLAPDDNQPFVGKSAFAHKGGMHVAGMRRHADSYQHIDPELVGNSMRVLVSDLSGKGNMLTKAEQFGLDLNNKEAHQAVQAIKDLEHNGYVFEGAEASVAMLLRRIQPDYQPPFRLMDFTVTSRSGKGECSAEAVIKLEIGGETVHTAAEGNGPVNALDKALRKALIPAYPHLADFQLADYKVRIIDGDSGTAAKTRVLIDTQNAHERWSTVGASTNIIEASWHALVDSVEYGLLIALK